MLKSRDIIDADRGSDRGNPMEGDRGSANLHTDNGGAVTTMASAGPNRANCRETVRSPAVSTKGCIFGADWHNACGNCGNCRNRPRPTLLQRPRRGLGHLFAPLLEEVAAVSDLQRRRAVADLGVQH